MYRLFSTDYRRNREIQPEKLPQPYSDHQYASDSDNFSAPRST